MFRRFDVSTFASCAAAALSLTAAPAAAQAPCNENRLMLFGVGVDEFGGTFLGEAFDVDGDLIAAGMGDADLPDAGLFNVGAVLLYERDGVGFWRPGALLREPVADQAAFFGASVAIAGDQILVGLPGDDDAGLNAGAVRVFERDPGAAWKPGQKILPIAPAADAGLGEAIAVDGDRAVVGACEWGLTGAAFVYERDAGGTWALAATLQGDDTDGLNRFGETVALVGDLALVGDPREGVDATDTGAAYAFVRQADGTWIRETKLMPDDLANQDRYGAALAVAGDPSGGDVLAVVGAPWANAAATNSGAAYAWRRDADGGWAFEQKLVAANGASQDFFGDSVAIANGAIHVGAHGDDGFEQEGSVSVFTPTGPDGAWAATGLHRASVPRSRDFGQVMATDGTTIVAGAPGETYGVFGTGSGAGYVLGDTDLFELTQNSWTAADFEAPDCNGGVIAYARSYDLAADERTAGRDLEIHCVTSAGASGGLDTRILTLYADLDGGDPVAPGIDLVPLSSGPATGYYPATEWVSFAWTFDPPLVVPAGTVLVAEVEGPGNPDANSYGQANPTFIRAPACAIDQYTDLASFEGFEFHRWVQRMVVRAIPPACPGDLDGNGTVGFADLAALLAAWGPCPAGVTCPADLDGDGTVSRVDLDTVLGAWGPCP